MPRSTLSVLILTLLIPLFPASAQETNHSDSADWMKELHVVMQNMGVSLDATNMSRAALLASVRTMDYRAEIVSDEQWTRIQHEREGLFNSPGFRLGITNGLPVITETPTNAPASAAGLQPGDIILGIGTQLISKISLPAMQQQLKEWTEPTQSIRYVRSGITNRVELTLAMTNEPAIEIVELLPNQIGYIKINGLYPGSGRDVVSRIRAWSENKRDGMILDLRGAGGYDATAVTQIASLFSRSGQFLFAFRDSQPSGHRVVPRRRRKSRRTSGHGPD